MAALPKGCAANRSHCTKVASNYWEHLQRGTPAVASAFAGVGSGSCRLFRSVPCVLACFSARLSLEPHSRLSLAFGCWLRQEFPAASIRKRIYGRRGFSHHMYDGGTEKSY